MAPTGARFPTLAHESPAMSTTTDDDRLEADTFAGCIRDPLGGVWWPEDPTGDPDELWAAYDDGRGAWHN